jgi:hypothetical protein
VALRLLYLGAVVSKPGCTKTNKMLTMAKSERFWGTYEKQILDVRLANVRT